MRERGDYAVPYLNNRYRFDKPPFTYWCQVASYRLFGENEFGARFPSAVAATLTSLLLFAWGRSMANERLGLWAAIIFATSLQVFVHAKAAVADMWLVFFVTAAHWAGFALLGLATTPTASRNEAIETKRWWWLFYVSLAFAFLAKGPIGWTPILTVVILKPFLRRRDFDQRFRFLWGWVVLLAIVALWGIPALIETGGEFFWTGVGKHVVNRAVISMEGHGGRSMAEYLVTMPFYFFSVFLSFFPWSIKLPSLCRQLWRKRDAIDNYLLTGIAIVFLIFSLVRTKLPHYTLPAYPLLAFLLARHLVNAENGLRTLKRIAVPAVCAFLAVALVAFRYTNSFSAARKLAAISRAELLPAMDFGAVEFVEPSLIWYFRAHVRGWMTPLDPTNVKFFMQRPGPRFLILPTDRVDQFYAPVPASWKQFSVDGFNLTKGKGVDVTILIKRE